MENMAHLSAVRSAHPRARVLSIDAAEAKAPAGVVGVLTAEDMPQNKAGHIKHDQYTLIPIGGLTHYLGDAIALVWLEWETLEKEGSKGGLRGPDARPPPWSRPEAFPTRPRSSTGQDQRPGP